MFHRLVSPLGLCLVKVMIGWGVFHTGITSWPVSGQGDNRMGRVP